MFATIFIRNSAVILLVLSMINLGHKNQKQFYKISLNFLNIIHGDVNI